MISELKGDVIKLESNKICFNEDTRCHFDPDIRKEAYSRTPEEIKSYLLNKYKYYEEKRLVGRLKKIIRGEKHEISRSA